MCFVLFKNVMSYSSVCVLCFVCVWGWGGGGWIGIFVFLLLFFASASSCPYLVTCFIFEHFRQVCMLDTTCDLF